MGMLAFNEKHCCAYIQHHRAVDAFLMTFALAGNSKCQDLLFSTHLFFRHWQTRHSFNLYALSFNTSLYCILSCLWFYWLHCACGCLLHFIAGGGGMAFQHGYKRWFHIQGTRAPWAWCICLLRSTELWANICFALETTFDLGAKTCCQISGEKGSLLTQKVKLWGLFTCYWSGVWVWG